MPRLQGTEWFRWGWRQLTSMRTALVLLLLLALVAIPGSVVPQRSADPNGVRAYFSDNPDAARVLDALQLFDVYSSAWFSAIYLLLFVSLIGCVIPRAAHHLRALRACPPRTPARLERLPGYRVVTVPLEAGKDASAQVAAHLASATEALARMRYRTEQYRDNTGASVSAERGYLRESGNLIFHIALVGVLVSVGVGASTAYTAQGVVIEGASMVNQPVDYTSFSAGPLVEESGIAPFAITLEDFDVTYQPYQPDGKGGSGQAGDFVATVTVTEPGQDPRPDDIRVNHPLAVAGSRVFLLGNGYAPTVTVRNHDGEVVFSKAVPFLPQDENLTSVGVVKVPDGMREQLGLVGFLYPTQVELKSGAFASAYPALVNPVITLNVFSGDLGIDDGTPRSVYVLDQDSMTRLTGGNTEVDPIELSPGQTQDLPNGWGSITFEDASSAGASDSSQSVKRFVSLSIHRDSAATWVLISVVVAVAGLLLALFVPRRRMWVKVAESEGSVRIEYAGLARGEDPALGDAVAALAARHGAARL